MKKTATKRQMILDAKAAYGHRYWRRRVITFGIPWPTKGKYKKSRQHRRQE